MKRDNDKGTHMGEEIKTKQKKKKEKKKSRKGEGKRKCSREELEIVRNKK